MVNFKSTTMKANTFGSVMTILVIMLCVIVSVLMSGCASGSAVYDEQSYDKLIDEAKADGRWAQFEACINAEPSDAVCDSCWREIIERR